MASPRFIFGGWDPFPHDSQWMLWQKILGILVDCLNDGNDADPGATPQFFPEGFTPRRGDQKIQRIQMKVLGILIDKFDGHFGPPVAAFAPASKPTFYGGFYNIRRDDTETVVLQRILGVLIDRAGLPEGIYSSRPHEGVRELLLKILLAICTICEISGTPTGNGGNGDEEGMEFSDTTLMHFSDGTLMHFS